MGQTLTHGVYLPDEGERNCYSGLAANWQILDTSVGTIAAHTSALAGKAPLVHTHTKSDITDFPVYGTTAGTICEGNDSRLSDARTPVAHTHGNITNDGTLGTASKVVITDSNKKITTSSVSDTELGYLSGVSSNVQTQLNAKADDSGVIHKTGNETFSGEKTSTDNFNIQKAYPMLRLRNSDVVIRNDGQQSLTENKYSGIAFKTSSDVYANAELMNYANAAFNSFRIVSRWYTSTTEGNGVGFDLYTDANTKGLLPTQNRKFSLGSSALKWKTLNGTNPGALSLPKTESERYSFTDLSSISGIGVDDWVLDGRKIVIAAEYVITGWLYVCIACDTDGYVILQTGGYSYPNCFYKVTGTPIAGYASAMIPIVEGIALALYLKGTSLIHARYYPAAGNV